MTRTQSFLNRFPAIALVLGLLVVAAAAACQGELGTLRAEVDGLRNEVARLNATLQEAETSRAQGEDRIEALDARVASLAADAAQAARASLVQQAALRQELTALGAEVATQGAMLSQSESARADQEEALGVLDSRTRAHSAALNILDTLAECDLAQAECPIGPFTVSFPGARSDDTIVLANHPEKLTNKTLSGAAFSGIHNLNGSRFLGTGTFGENNDDSIITFRNVDLDRVINVVDQVGMPSEFHFGYGPDMEGNVAFRTHVGWSGDLTANLGVAVFEGVDPTADVPRSDPTALLFIPKWHDGSAVHGARFLMVARQFDASTGGYEWQVWSRDADAERLVLRMSRTGELILQDYLRIAWSNGTPPPAECATSEVRGRVALDARNGRLYVCRGGPRGWDFIELQD